MNTITVSKNLVTGNERILKCKNDVNEKLYLAYSRFDKAEDQMITGVDNDEKITTPIMCDKSNQLIQIVRGVMVSCIYLAHTNTEEVTSIHPATVEEFVNILKKADGVFNPSGIGYNDDFENGAMITAQTRERIEPVVNYFLVYEEDINAYKVYRVREVDF